MRARCYCGIRTPIHPPEAPRARVRSWYPLGCPDGELTQLPRSQEQPEEGQPPIIGTLYVAKFWARSADRLTVTLAKGDVR
jgi:hypothetical protein